MWTHEQWAREFISSEPAWDLDFNDEGDKLDTVPVWRNNGSFNALDKDDFEYGFRS